MKISLDFHVERPLKFLRHLYFRTLANPNAFAIQVVHLLLARGLVVSVALASPLVIRSQRKTLQMNSRIADFFEFEHSKVVFQFVSCVYIER